MRSFAYIFLAGIAVCLFSCNPSKKSNTAATSQSDKTVVQEDRPPIEQNTVDSPAPSGSMPIPVESMASRMDLSDKQLKQFKLLSFNFVQGVKDLRSGKTDTPREELGATISDTTNQFIGDVKSMLKDNQVSIWEEIVAERRGFRGPAFGGPDWD